jgi:preprotein translocase subunit SecE
MQHEYDTFELNPNKEELTRMLGIILAVLGVILTFVAIIIAFLTYL